MPSYFLCGIGGSGMSALAAILIARGATVAGSDRSHDRGETPEKFARLAADGILLSPQDGSGLNAGLTALVVSSAVEETIADVQAARRLGVPIRTRADLLAEMFNAAKLSIAVGGTSGKSTVTAMIGWILQQAGLNPTIVNGAPMTNFADGPGLGNAVAGSHDLFVSEVDESDGSIALFRPTVAVLTNVTLDHKPMAELRSLFTGFLNAAKQVAIVNRDDPESMVIAPSYVAAFGFDMPQAKLSLPVPGRHNIANARAALAAVHAIGVPLDHAAAALGSYRGIKRRFETVGAANGITVIDDFAHNPDKIAATLRTLHEQPGRVLAIFQPHGFGPTRLMRAALTQTLAENLREDDWLIMPEIYYAGGTAAQDISSANIVDDVIAAGRLAIFVKNRADIPSFIRQQAVSGDRVIVMGARDDTLPAFAQRILESLT